MHAQRRRHARLRSLLSGRRRPVAHAAHASAVRARHRFHGCLCASRLVCAPRLSRRHPGCARPRLLRGRLLSLSQRGQRRRGNHRMAAHTCRMQRLHRHVRIFVSGHDAVARSGRAARRPRMHRAAHDRRRSLSRLVLSPRRAASRFIARLGHTDATRRRAPQGTPRCERRTRNGMGRSSCAVCTRALRPASRHRQPRNSVLRARLVRASRARQLLVRTGSQHALGSHPHTRAACLRLVRYVSPRLH